ncbi:MAG: hypothetical protein M9927_20015 [Anaerolineae bacterium]|nr:hypothetical protein [Anaerolineae bacterium]
MVPSAVQPAAPARVIAQPQVTIAAARPAMADAAAAGRLTAQPEPPPAPTIHVTIGRIEVRATPASTASVAQQAQTGAHHEPGRLPAPEKRRQPMSGPFALAAVSAVLRRLLTNGIGDVDLSIFGGAASVITLHPPDLVGTGANELAQLNSISTGSRPMQPCATRACARSATGERLSEPAAGALTCTTC